MKIKTSITISDYILKEVDFYRADGNRSKFIENAVLLYIQHLNQSARNKKDIDLINQNASLINKEALDVLSYQMEI